MTKLWLEVHIGDEPVKFACEQEIADDMLDPARVDDVRKELIDMAEALADRWDDKSGAADIRMADSLLQTRKLIGEAEFAKLLCDCPLSEGVRTRLINSGVTFPAGM